MSASLPVLRAVSLTNTAQAIGMMMRKEATKKAPRRSSGLPCNPSTSTGVPLIDRPTRAPVAIPVVMASLDSIRDPSSAPFGELRALT